MNCPTAFSYQIETSLHDPKRINYARLHRLILTIIFHLSTDLFYSDVGSVLHELLVSSRLDDVDFAGRRPLPVDVLGWQHPDGRPQPVAQRHLGPDLDLAVNKVEGLDSSKPDKVKK